MVVGQNVYRAFKYKVLGRASFLSLGGKSEQFGNSSTRLSPLYIHFRCMASQKYKPSEQTPTDEQTQPEPPKSKMINDIHQMLNQLEGNIVLNKRSGYYEMYGDQAIEYSKRLNIPLGERVSTSKSNPAKIEMIKFNESQAKKHIHSLVMKMNKSVAIFGRQASANATDVDVDDILPSLKEPSETKSSKPKLLRIITAGTLTDESFLDRQKSNFLMSLLFPRYAKKLHDDSKIGMAWVDVGVGTFYYETTTLADLVSDVARISPAELIVEPFMQTKLENAKKNTDLDELSRNFLINYQKFPRADTFREYIYMFEDYDESKDFTNSDIHLDGSSQENDAIMGLLHYVRSHLPDTKTALRLPEHRLDKDIMKIDSISRKSLELLKALRNDEITGTLFQSIKKTSSLSGTRLLTEWIKEPLLQIDAIKMRQKHVKELLQYPALHSNIQTLLKASNDPERILQNFSRGMRRVVDIHKMAQDLILFEKVKMLIENNPELKKTSVLQKKANELVSLTELWETIYKYIDSEPPTKEKLFDQVLEMNSVKKDTKKLNSKLKTKTNTGDKSKTTNDTKNVNEPMTHKQLQKHILQKFDSWLVNPAASEALTKYHAQLADLIEAKIKIQKEITQKYEQEGLRPTFKYEKLFGYFLHVRPKKGVDIEKFEKENQDRIIKNGSGKVKSWYIYDPEWASSGESIDKMEGKIRSEERVVLMNLATMILEKRKIIRSNCKVVDELDVYCSFAQSAIDEDLVCPVVNTSQLTEIIEGRHIMVDHGTKEKFTPNSCVIGKPGKKNMWVITGPNMSGKSTFLRQTALITILAQMGSYVPAKQAKIGIVDQIFCRIGARDDISRSQSTFLVEMLETSNILRKASKKSLAILDEVGRGTGYSHGLSISAGTLLYISKHIGCRTLYATHFGTPLTDCMARMEYREKLAVASETGSDSTEELSPEIEKLVFELDTEKYAKKGLEDFEFCCTGITVEGERETPDMFDGPTGVDFKTIYAKNCKFDRKLVKGVCDNSHGLLVAMLHGFPDAAIDHAQEALHYIAKEGIQGMDNLE